MRIILASTSPRRIDLMRQARLNPEVLAPNTDETPKRGESPRRMVARLSEEKALSTVGIAVSSGSPVLIVASDTTVVAPGGKLNLGKPNEEADAFRMLKKLVGRTHTVLTGYCVLQVNQGKVKKKIVRVVSTRVTMRKLSDAAIRRYIATGEPMDKAGSYAAQGLGMALIEKIQGSYTNVVGLPMGQLLSDLEKHFGLELFV